MGAFNTYLNTIKGTLAGPVAFGGTLFGVSEGVPVIVAQAIKGGFMPLDSLDTLVDLPFELLQKDMEVVVREYEQGSGAVHPRGRYYLKQMPPDNTRVSEVPSYVFADYWARVDGESSLLGDVEAQYAANFEGKRPLFLPTEISSAAYQAGYPTEAAYIGGNPADKIWTTEYDPLLAHSWVRQRVVGTTAWGIPVSLNAAGDYEANQYIDTIFIWVAKASPAPARPIQPADYSVLPTGWQNTPGDDYETRILTEKLYRSSALKNALGVLKSSWDLPILVSDDPDLVRYGNTPGNTDFLNNTYWRGYFTPGFDTYQASRPNGASNDWTVIKIDQESGDFDDFCFKNFPIGSDPDDLADLVPTVPHPFGGVSPNDCFDAPPAAEDGKILYMSKSTKFADGSFKTPWSLWRRFDGLDVIQAAIVESPGDTFFQTRNEFGNLEYQFAAIELLAKLYKGNEEIASGSWTAIKWYRGDTLIVFDSITRKATNLGIDFNAYHEISPDGKTLTINPQGVDVSQQYKVAITHISRPTDYEDTILLKDATDDGSAYVADISSPNGRVFKNQAGLYRFDASFFKGGLPDTDEVVFEWTIRDALGNVLANGLRNGSNVPLGDDDDYVGSVVYVNGTSIDQFATLYLRATFGQVVREDTITLTDVTDGSAVEALWWGYGSTDPGNPTDFTPRTLTKDQVLALDIDYSEDAEGAWYVIWRIGGVWSGEMKIRSESARPNGGISLLIFKNVEFGVDGAPAAPAVPGSGSIVPAGWTTVPSAYTGGQDRTYQTACFFLLRTDVDADPTVLTRDNYTPSGTYGTPFCSGFATPPTEIEGDAGANGWTPIPANEIDDVSHPGESRVVEKIIDWVGGTGTKPAANTEFSYVGASGLGTISNAVDKKGPAGNAANMRPQAVFTVGTKRNSAPTNTFVSAVYTAVSQQLNVTNSWSQTRAFLIRGEVPVSNDSGNDSWSVRLRGSIGSSPSSPTLDANYSRQDYVSGGAGYVHKIRVETVVNIAPGETHHFFMEMVQVDGGNSKYNEGFIQAIGL